MENQDFEIKIVLVGDSGVGKTTLINVFSTGRFEGDSHSTIGSSFTKGSIETETGKRIDFTIWDTAGQEKFNSLIPLYLRKASAIILVFDATSNNPISSIEKFYSLVHEQCEDINILFLCGNKVDLIVDEKKQEEVYAWAQTHSHQVFLTSAKSGLNVNELFSTVAEFCYNRLSQRPSENRLVLDEIVGQKEQQSVKKCC